MSDPITVAKPKQNEPPRLVAGAIYHSTQDGMEEYATCTATSSALAGSPWSWKKAPRNPSSGSYTGNPRFRRSGVVRVRWPNGASGESLPGTTVPKGGVG